MHTPTGDDNAALCGDVNHALVAPFRNRFRQVQTTKSRNAATRAPTRRAARLAASVRPLDPRALSARGRFSVGVEGTLL